MIVTQANASLAISILSSSNVLFVDTETTGLMWHQGQKPFSIIIADECNEPWYFNLLSYNNTQYVVSQDTLLALQSLFLDKKKLFVAHNAKFDWHMLANLGFRIENEVYDTQSMHRLIANNKMSYSLDSLTGTKDDTVKKWISKNAKIAKVRDMWGDLQPAYWRVPFEMIVPYAEQDVLSTRSLFQWQQEQFRAMWGEVVSEWPEAFNIELQATRTIWKAERRGILLDVDYTVAARDATLKAAAEARAKFKEMTGEDFLDSDVALDRIFQGFGIKLPHGKPSAKLKKTKPKTDEETLLKTKHPLAQVILDIRKPEKKVSTYFDNYIGLRGLDGAVHTDFRQTGADTLRMSASAPNVQNCPDESEDDPQPKFIMRGCFIPRPGFKLVSIDFAAQEMRVIIDAAKEIELAERIIAGEDVHQSTANMMGVARKPAKSIGFGIIYGSGAKKIGQQIGVSEDEARRLRELYFSKLPNVKRISRALMGCAESNGYIITRFGNRLYIDDGFAYKAVNYFVQGSSAMHTKNAANKVDEFLENFTSKILLLIHDELLLEIHESEMSLIPKIQQIMQDAYPHDILPQGTGVEVYKDRWGGDTCSM